MIGAATISMPAECFTWVFPVASAILLGFIAFFGFDLARHWSNWLLALALFDTLTLALVVNEWRNWSKD